MGKVWVALALAGAAAMQRPSCLGLPQASRRLSELMLEFRSNDQGFFSRQSRCYRLRPSCAHRGTGDRHSSLKKRILRLGKQETSYASQNFGACASFERFCPLERLQYCARGRPRYRVRWKPRQLPNESCLAKWETRHGLPLSARAGRGKARDGNHRIGPCRG